MNCGLRCFKKKKETVGYAMYDMGGIVFQEKQGRKVVLQSHKARHHRIQNLSLYKKKTFQHYLALYQQCASLKRGIQVILFHTYVSQLENRNPIQCLHLRDGGEYLSEKRRGKTVMGSIVRLFQSKLFRPHLAGLHFTSEAISFLLQLHEQFHWWS